MQTGLIPHQYYPYMGYTLLAIFFLFLVLTKNLFSAIMLFAAFAFVFAVGAALVIIIGVPSIALFQTFPNIGIGCYLGIGAILFAVAKIKGVI